MASGTALTFRRADCLQDWLSARSAPRSSHPQGRLPTQPSGTVFLSALCEHSWPFKAALWPRAPRAALPAWKLLIKAQGEVKNKQPGTGPAWETAQRGGPAGQAGNEQPRGRPERVSALPLRPPTDALRMVTTSTGMWPKEHPISVMKVQPALSQSLRFSGPPVWRISILGSA